MKRHEMKSPSRDASSFRRKLIELAIAQGWRVERTEKGHWRLMPPDKTKPIVTMPGTSVSRSGMRNALADLRRSGLIVNRDAKRERKTERWQLENAEERKTRSFSIPPRRLRASLQVGDTAKLIFMSAQGVTQPFAERMWVEIIAIRPDGYVGLLRNEPVTTNALCYGQKIHFDARHVIDLEQH